MPFEIYYTQSYKKRERKFFKKHKELLSKYEKVLKLMEVDPYHPSLRLHRLQGKLDKLHSVSLDIQYRITIELYITAEKIIPVNINTHDDVYK